MARQVLVDDAGQVFTHTEKPSVKWKSMRQVPNDDPGLPRHWETWENDIYYCSVERFDGGFPVGGGPYVRIGIGTLSNEARHDWREFQWIKNDIAGPEWEAVELYPAESRLLDPSNYYYLFCVPSGVLRIGMFSGRRVLNPSDSHAPQRPFCGGVKDYKRS